MKLVEFASEKHLLEFFEKNVRREGQPFYGKHSAGHLMDLITNWECEDHRNYYKFISPHIAFVAQNINK